jgi:hypothetical protein
MCSSVRLYHSVSTQNCWPQPYKIRHSRSSPKVAWRRRSLGLLTHLHFYMYITNTVVNATILFLYLFSFILHVSAVTGHHQVYFHLRSCHTARKLKFKTTSSQNVVAAFQSVSYIRISLSVMFNIPVNVHSSIWFKILKFFIYNLI